MRVAGIQFSRSGFFACQVLDKESRLRVVFFSRMWFFERAVNPCERDAERF